jgi:hypothetical protein
VPSPAPDAPRVGVGSQQQPLPLGASATFADGWQFVVTGATPEGWDRVRTGIPSAIAPPPDQRYMMIGVQGIYVGQGNGVLSAIRLGLVGKSGQQYDQLKNSCGIIPGTIPPNLVPPNGGLTGNVCFSVPASDVDGLLLYDNQSLQGDRVYFALR